MTCDGHFVYWKALDVLYLNNIAFVTYDDMNNYEVTVITVTGSPVVYYGRAHYIFARDFYLSFLLA